VILATVTLRCHSVVMLASVDINQLNDSQQRDYVARMQQ